jgi:hypothetical protein
MTIIDGIIHNRWDKSMIILPIDDFHDFSRWLKPPPTR